MLGTGFIAEFRAQVYARLQGVQLVSVLGRSPEKTLAFARRVGIGHGATSWDQLMSGPAFDAVDLCLPNNRHLEYALLAADAGKHILCEKPLGMNEAEALEMLAAVERAGVIHAYGENMVHAPDFREILDIVASGSIGKPLWVRGREAHFGPHSPWFWKKAEAGGGALIDMGCHLIAVFNLLLGENPSSVFCHAPTLHHDTDCDDIALALRNAGAVRGLLDPTRRHAGDARDLRLGRDAHVRPLRPVPAHQGVRAQPGPTLCF
jgi:predicted dehydrogenase